jgi:hypothetical protein
VCPSDPKLRGGRGWMPTTCTMQRSSSETQMLQADSLIIA